MAKPRLDVIPHPKAFLTHHIDIDLLERDGVNELELMRLIQNIFMENHGNCISGFNTISFDDEMTRNGLFRGLRSPYDHEFRNGNLRFDVYNLVRLAYAFKPEILNWPERPSEPGVVSLKLEHIAAANGIVHENAHDAVSDCLATIALAKMIKERAPKLFEHALCLTDKNNLSSLLSKKEPFFHQSSFHGKENKYMTLLYPIVLDASNKSKLLCIDLRHSPEELMTMSAEDIKKYLFTKREDLGDDAPKLHIVSVTLNKGPVVAPCNPKMLEKYASDFNLNVHQANEYIERIKGNKTLAINIQRAFSNTEYDPPYDVFETIYSGGFISNTDAQLRAELLRKSNDMQNIKLLTEPLFDFTLKMTDPERQKEIAIRAKWNNFFSQIIKRETPGFDQDELKVWADYLQKRLVSHQGEMGLTFESFKEKLNEVKIESVLTNEEDQILDKVERHVNNQKVIFEYVIKLANKPVREIRNSSDENELTC